MPVNVYDITFYKSDEDGNEILNEDGTTKVFRIKDEYRFKPLEYLLSYVFTGEDFDGDMLEEETDA